MIKKLVKVYPSVYPPRTIGPWRCLDQKQEHVDEEFNPDDPAHEVPVRTLTGANPWRYFWAIWSVDGWIIKRQEPNQDRHWFDAEGNEI